MARTLSKQQVKDALEQRVSEDLSKGRRTFHGTSFPGVPLTLVLELLSNMTSQLNQVHPNCFVRVD
jgi:hypothetical protein